MLLGSPSYDLYSVGGTLRRLSRLELGQRKIELPGAKPSIEILWSNGTWERQHDSERVADDEKDFAHRSPPGLPLGVASFVLTHFPHRSVSDYLALLNDCEALQ